MSGSPLLEVDGLTVRYGSTPALEAVSFTVRAGERIAVAGPNGAGKSTLFQSLAGLIRPSQGRIRNPGSDVPPRIGYLPQRPGVDWNFPISTLDAVLLGLSPRRKRKESKQAALDALDVVRLAPHAQRRVGELSGGQQQRLLIARALAMKSDILLMDEPLNGLDRPNQDGLFASLDILADHGVPVMVALHDLNLAARRFPRVQLLNRTLIADGPPGAIFTTDHLSRTYGSHLHVVQTDDGELLVADTCCDGHSHEPS